MPPVRLVTLLGLMLALAGCQKQPPKQAAPLFHRDAMVVLVHSEHDTLDGARQGLQAALRSEHRSDLPLPFPRVERRGDRFRVVLARGRFAALSGLVDRLTTGPAAARAVAAGEGSDDVVRLGIVCTAGEAIPLFAGELAGAPREIGRLAHGEVVVLSEDEGAEDESPEAEQGYLKVLAPRVGLLRSPDLLLPADCTPRDEDNDDGNGRLLAGGRLCLTTRFSGRDGEVARAALVAVQPGYQRCTRFPDAGTFDGFDQSPAGTQFAVEERLEGGAPGVSVYDVGERGQLTRRLHLPGLSRPAYLGDELVCAVDDAAGQGLVAIAKGALSGSGPAPAPRRLLTLPGPRFQPAVAVPRPAAPTLQGAVVTAAFHLACDKEKERRVRAVARRDFEQCQLEIEVAVGLDGKEVQRRCQINNAPSSLEQPISVPCPK